MKRKMYIVVFVLAVLIVIITGNILKGTKIQGVKIEKKDYQEKILVTGTIQGKNYSKLGPEISGTISEIYKREGELVKKGEVVAKLNSEEIEKNIGEKKALYDKAKSDLESLNKEEFENAKSFFNSSQIAYLTSKSEFEKYEELYEKRYINQLEYNLKKNQYYLNKNQWEKAKIQLENLQGGGSLKKSAEASLESSKNSLEALEKKLEKYFITAPFDGYITRREVEVGETVAPYSEMFQLSSQDEKIVVINLDEKYGARVNVGNSLKIYPYGDSENYSLGKIYFKGIEIDSLNGTLEIKTTIENELPEFLYNSTVNGVMNGREIKESVILDSKFIVSKNDKKFVYIENMGKSELIEIKGFSVIDGFLITEGISSETIILTPEKLEPGMRVKVQEIQI